MRITLRFDQYSGDHQSLLWGFKKKREAQGGGIVSSPLVTGFSAVVDASVLPSKVAQAETGRFQIDLFSPVIESSYMKSILRFNFKDGVNQPQTRNAFVLWKKPEMVYPIHVAVPRLMISSRWIAEDPVKSR